MKTCPSCKFDRNDDKAVCCFLCLSRIDDPRYKYDMEKRDYVMKKDYVLKKDVQS